jgi:trehalose 6-phosphate phosphatase
MPDESATISALAEQPDRTVLLVDFDGSLAPIVEQADDARPLPESVDALADLTAKLGRVGVVSGRPIEFLETHVAIPGLLLVGLYGMQRKLDGHVETDARVEPFLASIALATRELRDRFPHELVEPKSGIAITLHWRPQPDLADSMLAAADEVAARHGLGQLRTRMAIELRPPIEIDKGNAVRELVGGFEVGAFAGDDYGDLPAFAALGDSSLRSAIRIGVLSDEAPPELREAVDIVVNGPRGLAALLTRLGEEIA